MRQAGLRANLTGACARAVFRRSRKTAKRGFAALFFVPQSGTKSVRTRRRFSRTSPIRGISTIPCPAAFCFARYIPTCQKPHCPANPRGFWYLLPSRTPINAAIHTSSFTRRSAPLGLRPSLRAFFPPVYQIPHVSCPFFQKRLVITPQYMV